MKASAPVHMEIIEILFFLLTLLSLSIACWYIIELSSGLFTEGMMHFKSQLFLSQ